jgi:hypothetical protein
MLTEGWDDATGVERASICEGRGMGLFCAGMRGVAVEVRSGV